MRLVAATLMAAFALAGCGGGGGGGTTSVPSAPSMPSTPSTPAITWTAGNYPAASTYAAQCAAPRSGNDPDTGKPWPDKAGSALAEKFWLRSWTNDLYLWYSEVLDRDPALTANVLDYFGLLKTTATTASGRPKDRFHFTYDTTTWRNLSQSGSSSGYGLNWAFVSTVPPRRLVVASVESASPGATANITRGTEVQSIDGIDLVNDNTSSGVATLNAGLSPSANGQTHTFVLRDRAGTTRTVALTSATVVEHPVPTTQVLAGGVGYILFNDHIATAEKDFVAAINTLKAANVTDLVLDIRYNGGGYLDLASEVAYMIGGSRVAGKTFEQTQFNAKYPTTNPVIAGTLAPVLFHDTTQGFSLNSGQPLPTLNLSRVIVLTTSDTCSASESIINSLTGAGVQVVQVGGNTCGKPYGFYPTDNCGTTYFSIQFRGVNAVGFGDYADGFSANRSTGDARANLPGCAVADDYAHDLGDPAEGQLATALSWRQNGACASTISGSAAPVGPRAQGGEASVEGGLPITPPPSDWRTNRILRHP